MKARNVLIISRDPVVTGKLAEQLRQMDLSVECVSTGANGVDRASSWLPDVVIIGDNLQDLSPAQLTRNIQLVVHPNAVPFFVMELAGCINGSADPSIPVSKCVGQMVNRIAGLFSVDVDSTLEEVEIIECQFLRLDKGRHRAWVAEQVIPLTPTEFKLLWELASRPGYVLSRDDLAKVCLRSEKTVKERTIDAHVKSIRRKLNEASDLIETVHGVGYRFKESKALASLDL